MGWQAVKHVIDNSQQSGPRLLMLIVIAETIGDNRAGCWYSVAALAERSRVSERYARKVIRQLVDSGELAREERAGRSSVLRLANFTENPGSNVPGYPGTNGQPHPGTNGQGPRNNSSPEPEVTRKTQKETRIAPQRGARLAPQISRDFQDFSDFMNGGKG